jgi:hypothetical protein
VDEGEVEEARWERNVSTTRRSDEVSGNVERNLAKARNLDL